MITPTSALTRPFRRQATPAWVTPLTTYNHLVVCLSHERDGRGPGGRLVPRALRPDPARHPAARAVRRALRLGAGAQLRHELRRRPEARRRARARGPADQASAGSRGPGQRRRGGRAVGGRDAHRPRGPLARPHLPDGRALRRARSSRTQHDDRPDPTDRSEKDRTHACHRRPARPRRPHPDHHRRLRRARRARVGGLRRPAPARAGVGSPGLPRHLRRPRPGPGRADELLHDQPRGREVLRLLGRRRRRRADELHLQRRLRPRRVVHRQPRDAGVEPTSSPSPTPTAAPGPPSSRPTPPPRPCRRCSTWASSRGPPRPSTRSTTCSPPDPPPPPSDREDPPMRPIVVTDVHHPRRHHRRPRRRRPPARRLDLQGRRRSTRRPTRSRAGRWARPPRSCSAGSPTTSSPRVAVDGGVRDLQRDAQVRRLHDARR